MFSSIENSDFQSKHTSKSFQNDVSMLYNYFALYTSINNNIKSLALRIEIVKQSERISTFQKLLKSIHYRESYDVFKIFDLHICCSNVCRDVIQMLYTHLFTHQIAFYFSLLAYSIWKIFSILIYLAVLDRENKSLDTRKSDKCARNINNSKCSSLDLNLSFSSFSSFFSFFSEIRLHESLLSLSINSLSMNTTSCNTFTIWRTSTHIMKFSFQLVVLSWISRKLKNLWEVD